MSHMIEMKKVSKFYSTNGMVSTGFSKVDLDLDLGEFVVITGESGGGKSTLLNVISGLDGYEEGEMFVAGEDTGAFGTEEYENYRKTFIGNIFQDYNLINSYTVYQNIELAMILNGCGGMEKRRAINSILKRLGLEKESKVKVSKLSGGQKQRVAIARALAKDSPIIVADEPTGNLDSDSARNVMETLYNVSKGKLVIVVTHSYEQAEPYATRKIMMRDGRIVEDRKLDRQGENKNDMESGGFPYEKRAGKHGGKDRINGRKGRVNGGRGRISGKLSPVSQFRLGVRNTFNLATKFFLLLFIFLFMTVAVTGGYASKLSAESDESISGTMDFFFEKSPERLILKKNDGKAFSKSDIDRISATDNIDHIVKNDISLDSSVQLARGNFYIEGIMYNRESLKARDLAYGRLPRKSDEVVVRTEKLAENYDEIRKRAGELIGREFKLTSFSEQDGKEGDFADKKVKVSGISFKKSGNDSPAQAGYSGIYCFDELLKMQRLSKVAASSRIKLDFSGKEVEPKGVSPVHISERVPRGKVYVYENAAYEFYGGSKTKGRKMTIYASDNNFRTSRSFAIDRFVGKKNVEALLGIKKTEYDKFADAIFVNGADFNALFDKGDYQISAFMKEHIKADQTISALRKAGYNVLSLKKIMEQRRGQIDALNGIVRNMVLAILLLALFFISYIVIRLVIRSRNTYYSTLRILGATRRNIANLLRIELLTVMTVAVALVGGLIFAVNGGLVYLGAVNNITKFIKVQNYVILVIVMIAISLLIASRYSRKIFAKSAMTAYRGEA